MASFYLPSDSMLCMIEWSPKGSIAMTLSHFCRNRDVPRSRLRAAIGNPRAARNSRWSEIYRVPLERILLIPPLRSVCQWQCGDLGSTVKKATGCSGEGWNRGRGCGVATAESERDGRERDNRWSEEEWGRRRRKRWREARGRGGRGGEEADCREMRRGTMGKINRWNLGTM